MPGPNLIRLLSIAVAIPAGCLATLLIRREVAPLRVRMAPVLATSVLLGLWAALVMPNLLLLAITMGLAWALLVLGSIDLLAFRLPDVLTLPLTAAGLLIAVKLPDNDPVAHFAGAVVGFAALYGIAVAYRGLRGREGLGLGDAKLAAAAGAWLGWRPLPAVLLIASTAAFIAIGIGFARRGRIVLAEEIAFGAPLCLAFWIVWIFSTTGLYAEIAF